LNLGPGAGSSVSECPGGCTGLCRELDSAAAGNVVCTSFATHNTGCRGKGAAHIPNSNW